MRQGIGWRCPRSTSYASTTRRANHQFKYRHIQANTTVFRNLFIYYEWSYNTYIVQERSANSNKDYDNAKCKIRSHTSFCVATPATVSKPKLWRVQLWQLSNLDWKLTGANNIPSVSSVWYSQLEVCRLSSRCRRSPHTQTSSLVEWLQPSGDMYHISEYHRRNGDRIPDGWAEQSQPRTAGTGSVRGPTLEELPHRTNVGTNLNAPQRTKRVRPSTYDVNHAKTHPRKPYRTSLNAAAEWRELPVLCQMRLTDVLWRQHCQVAATVTWQRCDQVVHCILQIIPNQTADAWFRTYVQGSRSSAVVRELWTSRSDNEKKDQSGSPTLCSHVFLWRWMVK